MNHLSEQDLILLYYQEPEVSAAQRQHLSDCQFCQRELEALRQTLLLADAWTGPEPAPGFERGVWNQLVPQLECRPRRFQWRIWVGVAVAALVLVTAFVAGRASKPTETITAGLSDKARERILVISLADHFERTGLLLTDISNASAAFDDADRDRARDLVSENRLMRQVVENRNDQRGAAVLDELERFLLDVANAPDRVTPADLKQWQQRMDSNELLFKVRVTRQNLQTEVQKL